VRLEATGPAAEPALSDDEGTLRAFGDGRGSTSQRRQQRALSATIAVFGLILVGAFVAFAVILALSLVDRARSDARSMASALEQFAIRTFEVGDLIAEDALEYLRARGDLDGLATDADAFAYFQYLQSRLPPDSTIIFVDGSGTVRVRSDEYPATPVELGDRDWFREHLAGMDRVIGGALHSRITHGIIFVYTVALRDGDGALLGAVNLGIPSEAVIGPHALPFYGEGVGLTLMRRDGQLVARNHFPPELVGVRFDVPAAAFASEQAFIARRPVDDRHAIISSLPLPGYGLVAMASIPVGAVLRPLRLSAIGGLPMLVLVLGGAAYAHRRLVRQQVLLDESAARLATVLEAGHLGAWHWNIQTGHVDHSRRWAEMLGYRLEDIEPHVRFWRSLMHEDDKAHVRAALDAHLEGRTPAYRSEHRLRHKNGGWLWIHDSGRVVEWERSGKPLVITGTCLDITERRESEDRLKVVMNEVDHRAKNLLALVQAIVNLTRAESVADFKAGLKGRIAALARAHTLLTRNRWRSVNLEELVAQEMLAFPTERAEQMTFDGPPIRLTPAAAQAVAMTLHELATNAAKHGALSAPGGRIDLSWRRVAGDGDRLEVTWHEAGGPAIAPPERQGFGSTLIRQMIVHQLGGALRLDWPPAGLHCVFDLPARHLLPGGAVRGTAGSPRAAAVPQAAPARTAVPSRILVVEDDALLAMESEARLRSLGHHVVGPAGTLAEAELLADREALDAAVLDVNLHGRKVFPVAERLVQRNIPFIFMTGYEPELVIDARFSGVPVLRKPAAPGRLEEMLAALLDDPAARAARPPAA
jgi:PAS domain S-box-containing protein